MTDCGRKEQDLFFTSINEIYIISMDKNGITEMKTGFWKKRTGFESRFQGE